MIDYFILSQNEPISRPFHGFHTLDSEVGNFKSPDGGGDFTDFTDFTPIQKGVYVTHPPARPRAGAPGAPYTPLSRGVKSGKSVKSQDSVRVFWGVGTPPGVKSVKSVPSSEREVTV